MIERTGPLLGLAAAHRSARAAVPAPRKTWLCGRRMCRLRQEGLIDAPRRIVSAGRYSGRLEPDARSKGISADSRAVTADMVFFAVPGTKTDGLVFAPQAVQRGAVAIVAERAAAVHSRPPPSSRWRTSRARLAHAAARFYPRQPETIVAVTGTSGKTSVAAFVRQIWAALGAKAASLGTIGVVAPRGP